MNDLISRQALRSEMYHEAFEKDSNEQRWDSGCWIRYKMFERVVDRLPSAQRTGRWIDGKVKHIKNGELRNVRECSECGSSYFVYDYYNSVDEIPKFCPNCGARMEEEDGNQS